MTTAAQTQAALNAGGALTYYEHCPDGERAEVIDFRFVRDR